MRNRFSKKQIQDDKADVDLTPMLDVVFIMLIFFIVTASFIREATLPLNQPDEGKNNKPVDDKSFVVNIDSVGEVTVDGRRVDVRSVRALAAQYLAENTQGSAIIRAHEHATTEQYVAVADQIQKSSRRRFLLVTYSDE